MRRATPPSAICLGLCLLSAPARADVIENMLAQAGLPEYQSYLRVLTGVDPVPGPWPRYLQNRFATYPEARWAAYWLRDQFASFGLTPVLHEFGGGFAPNVIGELRGTSRPDDIYIVCGHFDTYCQSYQRLAPGCDDNGSGTAGVLMAARILAHYQFEGTLRFIGFSGEEQWMVGSQAYAHASRLAGENIAGVVNLDMILDPGFDNHAHDDYDLDIEVDEQSRALASFVADQYARYTPLDFEVHVDPGSASDHWAFWQFGYPAVGCSENTTQEIWGGSNANYHTVNDTMFEPDYDWEFGLEVVRGALASAAGLAVPIPEPASRSTLIMLVLFRGSARRLAATFHTRSSDRPHSRPRGTAGKPVRL